MSIKDDIRMSIRYATPGVKYSKESITEALSDIEFVEELINSSSRPMGIIDIIPKEILGNNPNLYFIAMEKDPHYMHYVPRDILRNNPQVCIEVLKKDPWELQDVPTDIQEQFQEDIINSVKKMPSSFRFMSDKVQEQNPEFAIEIVKQDPHRLCDLATPIKKENPQVCIEACKATGRIDGMGVPKEVFIENPDFVVELAEKELKKELPNFAFKQLPKELMENPKVTELYEKQNQIWDKLANPQNNSKVENSIQETLQQKSEVKMSKFREFYEKSKGKLKEAFNKLKGAINRDKQLDEARESKNTNDSNDER